MYFGLMLVIILETKTACEKVMDIYSFWALFSFFRYLDGNSSMRDTYCSRARSFFDALANSAGIPCLNPAMALDKPTKKEIIR